MSFEAALKAAAEKAQAEVERLRAELMKANRRIYDLEFPNNGHESDGGDEICGDFCIWPMDDSETVADVVQEMHRRAFRGDYLSPFDVSRFAKRIECACRRETKTDQPPRS